MPVDANATSFPTWNVTVNDTTTPLWFYCRQHAPTGASHCGAGMVFAVNAVADGPKNFTAFTALAKSLNGTSLTSNTTGSSSADSGAVGMGLVSPARAALSLGALVAAAANSSRERQLNSETCKVVGEPAMALTLARTSALTLVVASGLHSGRPAQQHA